jgi:hypothetical protein
LNPTDYAWSTLQSLTQLQPNQVKLLVEEREYPKIESDSYGYVLRVSAPIRHSEGLLKLHGMFFDNDARGKASLWRMFKASLCHLSLHSILTDYTIYKELTEGEHMPNLMFAISLVEDFVLRGYMKTRWPGLLVDAAYANHLSAHRFRDLSEEPDLSIRMAANLLSYSLIGHPVTRIAPDLSKEIESIHAGLLRLQKATEVASNKYIFKPSERISRVNLADQDSRVEAARLVASFFSENNAFLSESPTPPYTESLGESELFSNTTTGESEVRHADLSDALQELSIRMPEQGIKLAEKTNDSEAASFFDAWEFFLNARHRINETYRELDPTSHFESIIFPDEDYAEFVRTRSKLIGPIRLVLDQLRMIKTSIDEVGGVESGYVDIPMALQVIASGSKRNDVFIREDLQQKSESWAILADLSKSLETIQGEVRQIVVSLTEVAKELIPNQKDWACFAFNENMYVVKDFSEMYTKSVKGRIGGLPIGTRTYLPDGIRMAAQALSQTKSEIKVLMVASDGYPLGYDGIDKELVATVERLTRAGIHLVGLGVGSSLITKYFKSNCVINQPFDLMKYFVKTYLELASTF